MFHGVCVESGSSVKPLAPMEGAEGVGFDAARAVLVNGSDKTDTVLYAQADEDAPRIAVAVLNKSKPQAELDLAFGDDVDFIVEGPGQVHVSGNLVFEEDDEGDDDYDDDDEDDEDDEEEASGNDAAQMMNKAKKANQRNVQQGAGALPKGTQAKLDALKATRLSALDGETSDGGSDEGGDDDGDDGAEGRDGKGATSGSDDISGSSGEDAASGAEDGSSSEEEVVVSNASANKKRPASTAAAVAAPSPKKDRKDAPKGGVGGAHSGAEKNEKSSGGDATKKENKAEEQLKDAVMTYLKKNGACTIGQLGAKVQKPPALKQVKWGQFLRKFSVFKVNGQNVSLAN